MPTINITISTAQSTRIASALGEVRRLGRPATRAEIKQALIDHLKQVVVGVEHRAQVRAARKSLPDLGDIS